MPCTVVDLKYIRISCKYLQYGDKLLSPNDTYLLSRSSLEPLISLDLVGTKLYCFRVRVHCYHCLYIIFSTNPVRRSEELRGSPHVPLTTHKKDVWLKVRQFTQDLIIKHILSTSTTQIVRKPLRRICTLILVRTVANMAILMQWELGRDTKTT